MTESNRMPVVDFEKDKVQQYLVDQAKMVEKDNRRRFMMYKKRLIYSRIGFATLSSIIVSIYTYTMFAVKRETFLDDFDEPVKEDDY